MDFEVDDEVLCRVGWTWVPGVVASVNEHRHDPENDEVFPGSRPFDDDDDDDIMDDEDDEDFPTLERGQVAPYRVQLMNPIARPDGLETDIVSIARDGTWFIRLLTGENLIWHASRNLIEVDVWKAALQRWLDEADEEGAQEEANDLLLYATGIRFWMAAHYVATLADISLRERGQELLQVFVRGDVDEIATELPEDEAELRSELEDMSEMVLWLKTQCGVDILRYGEEMKDNNSHAELVAVENGDVLLLLWLMENGFTYCRLPSGRPKPRNPKVKKRMRCIIQEDKPSFPRDDRGWTPLHVAAVNGKVNIIDLYRFKLDEEVSRISVSLLVPSVEEFNALTLSGESALDLAKDEDTASSLQRLRHRLHQGVLNMAIGQGRLPDGVSDFSGLEDLISEQGLDIHESVSSAIEMDVYNRDGVSIALESGKLLQVQLLAKLLHITELSSWTSPDGLSMLHVAAGRSASSFRKMEDEETRILDDNDWRREFCREQKDKLFFIERGWSGDANFADEGKEYLEKQAWRCNHFRLTVGKYEEHCKGSEDTPDKIRLCKWLIRHGLVLPECRFIVENCDFPTAKFLLHYRLSSDRVIDHMFRDKAPLAMVKVKEFLYGSKQEASVAPSDIAIFCVRRPSCDKVLCITDASRLLLLDWLASNRYVDIARAMTFTEDTILHEAVQQKETLIATWLARNYPRLAHRRGATTGQLPIHLALERAEETDSLLEKAICKLMLLYTGEYRAGVKPWTVDKRAWGLTDSLGRTVKDYALHCQEEVVGNAARKPARREAYLGFVDMVSDVSLSIQSFESHVREHSLEDYNADTSDELRFLHSCIGAARLDVLKWYEQRYHSSGDAEYSGLGKLLGSPEFRGGHLRHEAHWLPRVFCTRAENFSVGDHLEVLGQSHKKTDALQNDFLDGKWTLHGWNCWSDNTYNFRIENSVCYSDVAGLEDASVVVVDTEAGRSVLLRANDEEEHWYSTHIQQSVDGVIDRVCLKRASVRQSDGYEFWADNGREVVLVKLEGTADPTSEPLSWQKARVVGKTSSDLTIAYTEADPPFQEVIPQSSSRINRCGNYKLVYYYQPCIRNFEPDYRKLVISGIDLARRYVHDDIVEWISDGVARADLCSDLNSREREFLEIFFSQAPNADLDELIIETEKIARSAGLTTGCAEMVSTLETKTYVLGQCWVSQTPIGYFKSDNANDFGYDRYTHRRLGLLRCAARLGRLDRVEWIVRRSFDSLSEAAIGALFDAAFGNHRNILEFLLAKGVDPSQTFAVDARIEPVFGLRIPPREYTLIELSVDKLSFDVLSFLIHNGHVPQSHINQELLSTAVKHVRAENREPASVADDRLLILKTLVSTGLSIAESETEIMRNALCRILSPDSGDVPVTRELICWLCSQGCDLATALNRERWLFREKTVPDFITELVRLQETTWPVTAAVARGASVNELELLFVESGVASIDEIRDPLDRTLLQVAVESNQVACVEWLVNAKGANINEKNSDGQTVLDQAQQLSLEDMVQNIRRLSS